MAWLAGLGLGLTTASALAQTTHWSNPALGNWFIPANWGAGVPQPDSFAELGNGGLAFISDPGASVSSLTDFAAAALRAGPAAARRGRPVCQV